MNATEVKEEKKQETAVTETAVSAEKKSETKSGCGCCGGRIEK